MAAPRQPRWRHNNHSGATADMAAESGRCATEGVRAATAVR